MADNSEKNVACVDEVEDVSCVSEDNSENESISENSDNENESCCKITELQEQINQNPYMYDNHIQLLKFLRKEGELDRLRSARNKMSQLFPLTEELWLHWIEDEIHISSTNADREKIIQLFEKAIQDYLSVPIWLEYIQFSIGGMGEDGGIDRVRQVCERALAAAGIHITQAASLWEAYREFESAIYSGLQPEIGAISTPQQQEQITVQTNRILSIFKRQLSVPLNDMEDTYEEYRQWLTNDVDPNIEQTYKKAKGKFKEINQYERALLTSEPPHLEAYKSYIEFELSRGEPARIQCLFERCLQENCLVHEIWLQYTKYLDEKLKVKSIVLSVYERATRNCPWSVDIWLGYLRAAERHQESNDKIKNIAENGINSGFTNGNDFLRLWMAICDYLRRKINWDADHKQELQDLRKEFERAIDHLNQYFGQDADPTCSLQQYWARIEAKFCRNMEKARDIWNSIMAAGHGNKANMWLKYYNLERAFGDSKHCRRTLQRAVNSTTDWPESICETSLQFEREEGNLEQFDLALAKCEAQLKRIAERKLQMAEKEADLSEQKRQFKSAKKSQQSVNVFERKQPSGKRKFGVDAGSMEMSKASKSQTSKNVTPPPGFKIPPGYPAKKQKIESSPTVSEEHSHRPETTKKEQTVFVSNLGFSVEEDALRQVFLKCGKIKDIRIVKNFKGKSKGYAYIEFDSEFPVLEALKLDRSPIEGRPMYVSPCMDRSAGEKKEKFKYSTRVEKNKLFIKNLPFTCSKDDLSTIFSQHGKLQDIRLVTYKSGGPKGLAYVEYVNEADATQAVLKTDGLQIGDHTISVAISNPPERKAHGVQPDSTFAPSLGGGKKESQERGKARTQVSLLPRALQTAGTSQEKTKNNMSNDDFRKMLLKK